MSSVIAIDATGNLVSVESIVAVTTEVCCQNDASFILIGDSINITKSLAENSLPEFDISIHHLDIGAGEDPELAFIAHARAIAEEGDADIVLSFGEYESFLKKGLAEGRLFEGLSNPAALDILFFSGRAKAFLDVGAAPAINGDRMLELVKLGSAFAAERLKINEPKISIIKPVSDIGLCEKAFELLRDNFEGFSGLISPSDLFEEDADAIVADGITGKLVGSMLRGYTAYIARRTGDSGDKRGKQFWGSADKKATGEFAEDIERSLECGTMLLGYDAPYLFLPPSLSEIQLQSAVSLASVSDFRLAEKFASFSF